MKVINFYGGPGSGKSTAAAGLFYILKKAKYNVELVTEFAKDLVYDESLKKLSRQNYVFANQEYRLSRLQNSVEIAITDSPLLLSTFYAPSDYPMSFKDFCVDLYKTYDNYSFFIERNHAYVETGRLQTEEESDKISQDIKDFLLENRENYLSFLASDNTPNKIFEHLLKQNILN
jgi:thymidylate kinase